MPAGTYKTYKQVAKRQRRDASPYRRPALRRQNAILNKAELKWFDTTIGATTVDSTAEVFTGTLNNIVQGDAGNNRDGATVRVKSIEYHMSFLQTPAAAATSATTIYFWLIQDRQPNGAALTYADVLTTTTACNAFPVVPNQYRFKVLRREILDLNAGAGVTTAYNNTAGHFDGYVKFKEPVEIRFNGNAGTVADVASNNFFIIMGSVYSDDTIVANGGVRLRFTG